MHLRVTIAGTAVPTFKRNVQLRRLLELGGYQVSEVQIPLWPDDRVTAARHGKLRLIARAVMSYPRLILKLILMPKPDLVIVGYPGWFDMPVVASICRARRIPVMFNMFISIYDTAVLDRDLFCKDGMLARILKWVDVQACRLADRVLMDTDEHADYIAELTGVPRSKIGVLPLGADESLFYPQTAEVDPALVAFHGTFVPLQGLDVVIKAAALGESAGWRLLLIGDGQQSKQVDELIEGTGARNITRTGLVPFESLPRKLARASVMLGIFGATPKAARVVPNKLYEGIALGRPVVTASTPAVNQFFGKSEVVMVPVGDHQALATAISDLLGDTIRRESIAASGHRAFLDRYCDLRLAAVLSDELLRAGDSNTSGQ